MKIEDISTAELRRILIDTTQEVGPDGIEVRMIQRELDRRAQCRRNRRNRRNQNMKKGKMSQNNLVLYALIHDGTLTPLEALRQYGIMRLGARVWDLKKEGWKIRGKKIRVKTRSGSVCVSQYSLGES